MLVFASLSHGISCQIFGLLSSFLINRELQVVQDRKSPKEYPVNAGVHRGFILGPTFFLLYVNGLPDDICNIAIYADESTLYSKYDQASDSVGHVGLRKLKSWNFISDIWPSFFFSQ